MSKHIPIHEVFYAFQGEGVHMGKSAFFIRTFGCPLHCPWCDSAGTWHKDFIPKKIDKIDVEELASIATKDVPDFVVITGGEPAIHKKNLSALCNAIKEYHTPIHLETSGAFDVDRKDFDWITLSPKHSQKPTKSMIENADEFKIIVEDEDSIDVWIKLLGEILEKNFLNHLTMSDQQVWLHPEWSQRDNPKVLNAISSAVKKMGSPFRAGYQLHKLYKVDSLDNRSKGLAPLGGNIKLGY